jgi:hypothetical protein
MRLLVCRTAVRPKKNGETFRSTARAYLCDGTTAVASDIVQDGEDHIHPEHFKDHIPKTNPYDVALRCDKGNVPQIQFNDDGVWHDFAPEGRTGLVAGPWFPCLAVDKDDRVSDLRVDPQDVYAPPV